MVVSPPRSFSGVFWLSWPVLMWIYRNKTKKSVQFPTALTWHANMAPFHCFNMASVMYRNNMLHATTDLIQLHVVDCIHDGILCLFRRNVITQGFTNMVTLPESDEFDCVTCTCIADVDWDGNNEILLGTYGQVRIVLKSGPKCLLHCNTLLLFSGLLLGSINL